MCVLRVPYFNSLEIRESGAKTAARRALRAQFIASHTYTQAESILKTHAHTHIIQFRAHSVH